MRREADFTGAFAVRKKKSGKPRYWGIERCGRSWREKMSVYLIFKIAAVGILVSVLSQVLKHSGREEHAFLTSLAGLILVLFWILPYIYELFDTIKQLFSL